MKKVTDLEGVFASGIHCGIKAGGKLDLAYLYVPQAVASAGVFTRNKCRAACLDYTEQCLAAGVIKAVIINSGNANAATGERGLADAEKTARAAAERLNLNPQEVAVASTGIIGVPLPVDKIVGGLESLLEQPERGEPDLAAEAILTTDTRIKHAYSEAQIGGTQLAVAGFAKGSGMIAPNMGTMLGFLATNAVISRDIAHRLLKEAVDDSFNMVSVDTDTSTNDMCLLFATGASGVEINNPEIEEEFRALLTECCVDLAKQIARDGEGAERLIEVIVEGADNQNDAKTVAKAIVESPLVKTAVCGADPNWGRVMMAIGKNPEVVVDQRVIDISFGGISVFAQGAPVDFDRKAAREHLRSPVVVIRANLNCGKHSARAWGCDLTMGYIKINVDYS